MVKRGEAEPLGRSVRFRDGESLTDALARLGLTAGGPVLVLAGGAAGAVGADEGDARRRLVEAAIVPIVRDEGVVVITGGTDYGVMKEVGRAIGDLSPETPLVGVAPDALLNESEQSGAGDRAQPEPHHRLIRTDGEEWGDEAAVLVAVAERLGLVGVVLVAVGGGEGTRGEIELALARGWPILLVDGLGGESSALARARHEASDERGQKLAGAIAVARERGVVRTESAHDLPMVRRALRWAVSDSGLLKEAWARYAFADAEAKRLKTPSTWGARGVIGLGALAAVAALALSSLVDGSPPWVAVKLAVLVLPLLAGLILALMQRSARAGSWVAMRGAAESLLREIYRFRASVGAYSVDAAGPFAESLAGIDARAGRRIIGKRGVRHPWPPADLEPPTIDPTDELLNPLTAQTYDSARVLPQLAYLDDASARRKMFGMRWMIAASVAGIVTTAALALSWRDGFEVANAIASAAAVATAVAVSWRQYARFEEDAEALRATALEVSAIRARWMSLPPEEHSSAEAVAEYASKVEEALAVENGEWERSVRQAQASFFDRQGG